MGGKSYAVVLRLVGENESVRLQTRWKDRDGRPTIVEASHIVEQVATPVPRGGASRVALRRSTIPRFDR